MHFTFCLSSPEPSICVRAVWEWILLHVTEGLQRETVVIFTFRHSKIRFNCKTIIAFFFQVLAWRKDWLESFSVHIKGLVWGLREKFFQWEFEKDDEGVVLGQGSPSAEGEELEM